MRRPLLLALTILAGLAAPTAPITPALAQPRNAAPTGKREVSSALAEARGKLETTDYDGAEAALKAIRGSDQPEAQVLLARSYLERGRYDEAEKTVAQVTAGGEAVRALAATVRARSLFARGKVAEAIKTLEGVKATKGGEARRARTLLGEYLIYAGKRADADEPLHKVIDDYSELGQDADGLAEVGRAAHLLRSAKDANQAFSESEAIDKTRTQTLMYRSELFLEKFDAGHAEDVTRDALKIAPKRADALLTMARIKLDQALDFDAAEALLKEALAINPKLAAVYAVRAGIALRDMDLAASDKAIETGLAINPADLELLSMRAATRFLSDDKPGFEAAKKDVFTRNPEYARFYSIVGEFAEWEHRYDDIVSMMKEATKVDPDDGRAWAQLGLTSMRNGQEDDGLKALNTAWSKDRYNVMVYNTLNLYEKVIPTNYETVEVGTFKIRYPKSEKKVLDRYVPRLAGEALASMKARYGFVPKLPTQVELYETRENFSVRTSGLPNIGIQGVCFGRVVAAMSPKSEPFNWGNVLWHELGHVFAIQLSKNHVPRWFTEGLSEYETIARRPEWNRELDPQLYMALTQNTLPAAVDMNRAFTHASDGLDVTVAYYASSQMMVFTVERFGMQRVVKALQLWGEGKRTPEVIEKAFGVPPATYDSEFRAWELNRLRRYKGQFIFSDRARSPEDAKLRVQGAPNDAKAHAEYALSLARAHKIEEAKKEIEVALGLDPKLMSAHYMAAKISMAEKNPAEAEKHLQTIRSAGGDGYFVQTALADVYEAQKNDKAFRFSLEAAHRWDPSQSEPLQGLFDIAVEEKREDDQLDILRKLAPLDQHNRRVWRGLMVRLVAKKQWEEARRVCESTLYVDVENAEIHNLCAATYDELGLGDAALFEAESALASTPKPKEAEAAHLRMAKIYGARKNTAEAKRHEDEARAAGAAGEPKKPGPLMR
ncbi:MAG: tetratricopeptide repeat protein [Polyangiaceae bacterium]|nr:tetratricopeptide repeat protein [Polyangiaceae bacterium]